MLPNSFTFLAFFAAIAVAYWLLPHRFRWPVLLATSLFFYATYDPRYVILLLGVTGVAYLGGLAVEALEGRARKATLAVSVVAVVGALLFFKYYAFLFDSVDALLLQVGAGGMASLFPRFPRLDLVLAVGLSFYTFSCISYVADVYSGRLRAERHFGHFALYVSYFPKLLAGPIERAKPFLSQIKEPVAFSTRGVSLGFQVFLWGMFKKVVIADHLAIFVDQTYGQAAFASPADLVLATYFFAFQLYCDFSGYSEMAIGASKMLGIDLMENFRRPYLSKSTPEFWARRWHLSLATWFRDYMYIPMGGSRVVAWRKHFNVMAVFLVSGLWHGAAWTFVVWGGLNGVYGVISDLTRKARDRVAGLLPVPEGARSVWAIVVTFHLILVTWVFFRADTLADATTILSRVAAQGAALPSLVWNRITAGGVLFSLGLIAFLLAVEVLEEKKPTWERLEARPRPVRWAVYYGLVFALVVLGTWQQTQFVYMQF